MGNQPIRGRNPRGKGKRSLANKYRKNERIRVPEVRVIGPDGNQRGIMQTKEAQTYAKKLGLDLVEISPSAKPPVCRVVDFGKYMYELSKKNKENKSASAKLKEVKFRINIDQHDYMTKIRRAESFLNKGNKLKITLMLRGREMEHKDIGFEHVKRAVEDLTGVGQADAELKMVGRNINVTVSPLPASKRKPKFITDKDPEPEDDDDEEEDEHEDSESES